MKNNFFNSPLANINLKPSLSSEVISQILYGEKFKILSKKKVGLRLKQVLIIILVILKSLNIIKTLDQQIKFVN